MRSIDANFKMKQREQKHVNHEDLPLGPGLGVQPPPSLMEPWIQQKVSETTVSFLSRCFRTRFCSHTYRNPRTVRPLRHSYKRKHDLKLASSMPVLLVFFVLVTKSFWAHAISPTVKGMS